MKILEHGHIELVDSMPGQDCIPVPMVGGLTAWGPGDQRVVDAARVSIAGREVRPTSANEKLLRYLIANAHTTPFETVRFTFDVKLPIFIARQWIRYRSGCLAGDVDLHFQRPDNGAVYPKSVEAVFRSFKDPAQVARAKSMRLRCVNEETLAIGTTSITSIWESGVQPVWLVSLESGRQLRLTDTHQVLSDKGWELFGDARSRRGASLRSVQNVAGPGPVQIAPVLEQDRQWLPIPGWEGRYEVSDQGRVRSLRSTRGRALASPQIKQATTANNGYPCVSLSKDGVSRLHCVHALAARAFLGETPAGLEIRHKNGNRLDPRIENLHFGTSAQNTEDMREHDSFCRLEVRMDPIVSSELDGEEMTYDLEVAGPHHNFVANGIVVHNSFNEMSARYGVLPSEFYVPELDRMQAQAKSNKQGSGEVLDAETGLILQQQILALSLASYKTYEALLQRGLARELARMVLPLNIYTRWMWTTDLHNLMHFLRQRLHSHAQHEIRVYAEAILELVQPLAPCTVKIFKEAL